MARSGLHGQNITSVMLARAQQRHSDSLDELLDAIDRSIAFAPATYFGVPCAVCREDCIPIPLDGVDCCGFCETPL